MVAFVSSFLLAVLMVAAVMRYARRRPVGTPLTWGEAMFAATFVFFAMFWAYGVVAHQWLSWADNDLKWRSDAYLVGPASTAKLVIGGKTLMDFRNVPFNVSKQTIRDLVAVLIYGLFLGAHVTLWSTWQRRGELAQRRQKALEERTTAYGRPLARKA
ncbi:MAG: hypothetical protein HYX34_12265 [Actinobacteria bacterium]|nr:hypothetical protein [Actinomycetota bacterium]